MVAELTSRTASWCCCRLARRWCRCRPRSSSALGAGALLVDAGHPGHEVRQRLPVRRVDVEEKAPRSLVGTLISTSFSAFAEFDLDLLPHRFGNPFAIIKHDQRAVQPGLVAAVKADV